MFELDGRGTVHISQIHILNTLVIHDRRRQFDVLHTDPVGHIFGRRTHCRFGVTGRNILRPVHGNQYGCDVHIAAPLAHECIDRV